MSRRVQNAVKRRGEERSKDSKKTRPTKSSQGAEARSGKEFGAKTEQKSGGSGATSGEKSRDKSGAKRA